MRVKAIVMLGVVCACSSSSSPAPAPDSGGDAPACGNTPQTNNGGSCLNPGAPSADAGDAGVPPVFCIDYTGSGQMAAGTMTSCKTMGFTFSTSPCSAVAAGFTPVGFCIRACSTPGELVQYYYTASFVADAQEQCVASGDNNNVWVPAQ